MSEENLTSQDKEELKRRLELLQKEYERTAERLQRAERREAVRKHVQNTISAQNRLLHCNTSVISESGSFTPEQISSLRPDTTKVRFHLPDSSPFSSLTCKQSLCRSHRLRSKRSRLRLQIRERESDTEESQEKMKDREEERWREERGFGATAEEKDMERGHTDEDRKPEEGSRDGTEELTDKLGETGKEPPNENKPSAADCSSVHQVPLLEVHDSPADRHSSSASSDLFVPSGESFVQSCSDKADDKGPGCFSYLNSCTLIEGLPFPVEYYVRTTRRMASAHSPVDLNAVIQSQLSGRGRRRSSRGRVTSQPPSEKSAERNESRKRGARGRRGRRRTRKSDSSGQSDSLCSSPTALRQEEPQPIITAKPSLDSAALSQLHLGREPVAHSQVYPIFRNRRRQTGKSTPQVRASINVSSHILPSLTSLAQTLRSGVFPNFGRSLTIFDMQDFHLPDDEFGQLKLQRLRTSCLGPESLVYSASFRQCTSLSVSEDGQQVGVKKKVPPLPHCSIIDRSLMFTEELQVESANQSEGRITRQTLDRTQEPGDLMESGISTRSTKRSHTLYASRSVMLNLSLSLTSHAQIDHSPSLIELGASPDPLTVPPSPQLTPFLSLPPNQEVASEQSLNVNQETVHLSVKSEVQIPGQETSELFIGCLSRVSSRETPDQSHDVLMNGQVKRQESEDTDERGVIEVNSPKLTNDILICSETERQYPISPALPPKDPHCPPNYLPNDPHCLPNDPDCPPNYLPNDPHCLPNDPDCPPNDPPNDPHCLPNDPDCLPNDPPNDPHCLPNDPDCPPNDPPNDPHCLPNDPDCPPNDPPNDPHCLPNDIHFPPNYPPNDLHCSLNDPDCPPNDPHCLPNDIHCPPNDPPNDPHCLPNGPCCPPSDALSDPCLPSNDLRLPRINPPPLSPTDHCLPLTVLLGDNTSNNEASVLPVVSANQMEEGCVVASALNLQSSEPNPGDSQVALLCCGALRKTHSLKALDGGCVLDVCLLQWSADDWCVCVAGEWSVCVWKQNTGSQQWRLVYTWTFTQSVISLQSVPESTALLCVCLGRLEITEARILCCPSTDGEFSEIDLYKGGLQAVLAVSDSRVTCCSSAGSRQNLQVFTLSPDGRVAGSLSLVPTDEAVQTLVLVEMEKDALIGWTENKRLLLWNMKSGQLLQTVCLMDSVSMATCLRGYSYRGVLCVLLQQVSVCDEDSGFLLFTLIALNPVSGKYLTLRGVPTPYPPSERLIDGDVCESALAGVFPSGLTVWNLTGGVACVYENQPAEVCRLARWAGPNTLLTGYLSGDVHIYQFSPFTANRTEFKGL